MPPTHTHQPIEAPAVGEKHAKQMMIRGRERDTCAAHARRLGLTLLTWTTFEFVFVRGRALLLVPRALPQLRTCPSVCFVCCRRSEKSVPNANALCHASSRTSRSRSSPNARRKANSKVRTLTHHLIHSFLLCRLLFVFCWHVSAPFYTCFRINPSAI